MFTGITRATGVITQITQAGKATTLTIRVPKLSAKLTTGASVTVDGVCLTVVKKTASGFTADVVPETLRRTIMSAYGIGMVVNIETPLKAGDPLDGHIVQGHVDGVGKVTSIRAKEKERVLTINAPKNLVPYLIVKGSVAINGVSMTIARVRGATFSVAVIPETWRRTNLRSLRSGSRVNLETDLVLKYLEKALNL